MISKEELLSITLNLALKSLKCWRQHMGLLRASRCLNSPKLVFVGLLHMFKHARCYQVEVRNDICRTSLTAIGCQDTDI